MRYVQIDLDTHIKKKKLSIMIQTSLKLINIKNIFNINIKKINLK